VPPPPVAGAAVGSGPAECRGVADGLCVAGELCVAGGLCVAGELCVAGALAEGLTLALGVVALAEPRGGIVGLAEPVTAGENGVGVGDGEDAEQAETDAEATMAKVAQQAAVNLELRPVPMMDARIVTGPPYASGRRRTVSRSRHRKRNRGRAGHCPRPAEGRSPEAPTAKKVKPIDGSDMKWPVHHWNIRLRD
jgi:hypothetical protein